MREKTKKVCPGARERTDTPTRAKVTTVDTFSGFQDFFPSTYHQGSVSTLMSQGSLIPKIRILGQKVRSVARVQTHRQADTKVNT